MTTVPDISVERRKILEIFQNMSLKEQYRTIGYLSEYADRNSEKQRAQEKETSVYQTSGKIIQFPAAVSV